MATKRTINVNVNSQSAVQNLQQINAALGAIAQGSQQTNQQLQQISQQNQANANATTGALGKIAKGFSGIGLAMKAAGIGLIVSTFNFLKDALMKNEKVAAAVNAVMGTLSSIVGQVVDAVINAYDKVSNLTNGFEHTKAVIGDLLTIALTPLKMTFFELQLAVKAVQLAWEKSIFGKKDPGTIKELQADITSLSDKLVDTGKKALDAGIDIAKNAGGMLNEVTKLGTAIVNEASKINVKSTYNAQLAFENMKKSAALNIAELEGKISLLENKAKGFETDRDNEKIGLAQRIQAGKDLIKVLTEEKELTIKKAKAAEALAAAESKADPSSTDKKVAAIKAHTDAVNAETEANDKLKSANEQLTAVTKTYVDIGNMQAEGVLTRKRAYEDFTNSVIKNEKDRLLAQKETLAQQEKDDIAALEKKRDQYAQDTEAYASAQEEILNKKQEYAIKNGTIDDQLTTNDTNSKIKATQDQLGYLQAGEDNEKLSLKKRIQYNDEALAAILAGTYANEEERTKAKEENQKARMALDDAEKEAQLANLQAVAGILDQGVELLGESTAAGKTLGIASALINTYVGITKALKDMPYPLNILASISTGIAGFMAVKKIIAVKVPGKGDGGGGAGGSGGMAPTASAPANFNVVGTSATNTLAQSISSQQNKPVKAYVVSKDVTTAQSLDRNAVNTATFS